MSVQVSYKKQFGLGLMLLLIMIGIMEISARTYDIVNPYCNLKTDNEIYSELSFWEKSEICDSWLNIVWGFDKDTGIYVPEANQHKKTININSEGFRGPEIIKIKQEETKRIFLMGGSTMMSLRATSDGTTIPGYVQDFFDSKNDMNVQIINAGISSFTSTQELELLKKKILQFNPDIIVVYDGTNDIASSLGYKPGKESLRSVLADVLNRYFPFWETPIVINHIISPNEITKIKFDDSDIDKKVKLWKGNLENICNIGEENNFETLIILQPIVGSGTKKLTPYEEEQFEKFDHSKVIPAYQKFADELNNLKNGCAKVEDFRNIFDEVEHTVFFDNAHVGIKSNKIVAEKIYGLLSQMISN